MTNKDLRNQIVEKVFQLSNPIDEFVRKEWQGKNYVPSKDEVKYACDQLCLIAKKESKIAFKNQMNSYKDFCKECDEIKERFQVLSSNNPVSIYCGIYQVDNYLYEEVFEKVSEVLGIYVPNTDYDYEY